MLRDGGRGWKQIFQPYVLGIAALSIALFAWGLGYKMERIHSGSDTVRQILVAKLWVKPRGVLVAGVAQTTVKGHLDTRSSAFLTVNLRLSVFHGAVAARAEVDAKESGNTSLVHSSRAPPNLLPFIA